MSLIVSACGLSGYQVNPFFQKKKPLQSQMPPLNQLDVGWAGSNGEPFSWWTWTKSRQWWPSKHPTKRTSCKKGLLPFPTSCSRSSKQPLYLLSTWLGRVLLLAHHSQAGFPHLFSVKKSLKSAGLKLSARVTSHKSCFFPCCARVQINKYWL